MSDELTHKRVANRELAGELVGELVHGSTNELVHKVVANRELAHGPANRLIDKLTSRFEGEDFCSDYNQKRPRSAFGHFYTCESCRRRNTKAN
jgi:hypothetical protein